MPGKGGYDVMAASGLLLAILWVVALLLPGWHYAEPFNIVEIRAGLFIVRFSAALVGRLAAAVVGGAAGKPMQALEAVSGTSLWMSEAKERVGLCGVVTAREWCDSWARLQGFSWVMIFMGAMTSMSLLSGAAFSYYYGRVRSTRTGRKWATTCFIAAPSFALIGVVLYMIGTLDFGHTKLTRNTSAHFSVGYFFACLLTIASLTPIITQLFVHKNEKEIRHDDDDYEYWEGDPFVMGATPPPGYGAHVAPPPSFGWQQQQQPYAQTQIDYSAQPPAGYTVQVQDAYADRRTGW